MTGLSSGHNWTTYAHSDPCRLEAAIHRRCLTHFHQSTLLLPSNSPPHLCPRLSLKSFRQHRPSSSCTKVRLGSRIRLPEVSEPVDLYQREWYVDDGPLRESELALDVLKPMYEPSPTVSNSIRGFVRRLEA